jgi:uncharacterized protein
MDVRAILHELTQAEGLPREALKAASAQRGEIVPVFLKEIEDYLALKPAARSKSTPLFFIFHLLGEWREKAAYRPLARLLRLPRGEVDRIFGDGITTTSHRVIASVFDGDPQPLYEIILDPNAEQFIRSRMCEALAMVTLRGEFDRDLADRFLRDAFIGMQPQAQCYVWVGWQSAIAMLGMSDLKSLVKEAFDRGLVDSHVLGFDHFEQDLRRAIEHPGEPWRLKDRKYTLFGDTTTGCRDGIASPSNTARIGSGGGDRLRLIVPAASILKIRSKASAETTHVPAAVARSSRSAACTDRSLLCTIHKSVPSPKQTGRSRILNTAWLHGFSIASGRTRV